MLRLRVADQQRQAELGLRGGLDVSAPGPGVLGLVVLEGRNESAAGLEHVLALLPRPDMRLLLLQRLKLEEWGLDTFDEAVAPGQGAGDGRVVGRHGRMLALPEEDLVDGAEVSAVSMHQANILFLGVGRWEGGRGGRRKIEEV